MQYRIGEFAKLSGTSIKTLRFYDQLGLLQPHAVDSRTHYRLYAPEQLQDLAAIRALKDLGASLDDIRRVVGKRTGTNERRKLLEQLRRRALRSVELAQRSLSWLDFALAEATRHEREIPVIMKQRCRARVMSVRAEVQRYSEIAQLETALKQAVQVETSNRMQGVLWHRCADSGAIEGEPFIEIHGRTPHRPGFELKDLPAATVACAYCDSDDRAAEQTYEAIDRWMHLHNYRLAGPKRELYVGQILEIQFPVMS